MIFFIALQCDALDGAGSVAVAHIDHDTEREALPPLPVAPEGHVDAANLAAVLVQHPEVLAVLPQRYPQGGAGLLVGGAPLGVGASLLLGEVVRCLLEAAVHVGADAGHDGLGAVLPAHDDRHAAIHEVDDVPGDLDVLPALPAPAGLQLR
eukprot:5594175-Alexandrium_andersonii.AAC.1